MNNRPLRVAVIIGSTREGRVGDAVAKWFTGRADDRDDLVLDVLDLIEFDLPAGLPEQATLEMQRFTARIDEAEAYVVVTPEYNRSFPASLKQAIDCAYDEWRVKPVGFVSYGYRSQGLHAVEQLRSIFTELHTVTMRDTVAFNLLDGSFARDGTPFDSDGQGQAVTTLLDELLWWGLALREARVARPYVC
ncbi:NADPH-dependent FMN reductase [Amycolatopsis regifaucium]|uniref:NADPH-dependent FMN reductase n=1 Tax=Amycolatopsis regifaucium TaxID=546365 RepID=A0A154M4A5_9PSEU|nr:NAD(P)H-dependent oxidoreductase [Amycolatopsis regifaucium]KZB79455.1 NADPH-dependent FMN reductase [Amycolatopsis regifaucium]OKA07637.1 NADPH-dependent FMN reductase [Amycolatopsis regifaucium]SFH06594.1 NAD(P)H-dependent FMN reductase [Amycolatopsis regifaucium]